VGKGQEQKTMRPDELLAWLRAQPFRPFRITLNSGRSYDIRHPEMLKVGRGTAYIFSYAADLLGPVEKMEMVSLLLMEHVEALAVGANTSGNGAQSS
jgi:hypothetical protein